MDTHSRDISLLLFSYSTLEILLRLLRFSFSFFSFREKNFFTFAQSFQPTTHTTRVKEEMLSVRRRACVSWRRWYRGERKKKKKMKNKLAELGENLNDGARVAKKIWYRRNFLLIFEVVFFWAGAKALSKLFFFLSYAPPGRKNSSTLKIYARNVCSFSGFTWESRRWRLVEHFLCVLLHEVHTQFIRRRFLLRLAMAFKTHRTRSVFQLFFPLWALFVQAADNKSYSSLDFFIFSFFWVSQPHTRV